MLNVEMLNVGMFATEMLNVEMFATEMLNVERLKFAEIFY
jgi:hypothetical protein